MTKLIREKDLISFLKESFYEYDVPKELAENILLDVKNIQGIDSKDVIESVDKIKELRPIAKYSGVSKEYLLTPREVKELLSRLLGYEEKEELSCTNLQKGINM